MRILPWLFAAAAIFTSLESRAEPVTDPRLLQQEQRAAVEKLANEGAALFQQGDFASALEKFERAEAIVTIPTITLERGRSLERLGRWVEASSAYERAASTELPRTASIQHRFAQQEATKALAEIAPKIPKLTVTIKNAKTAEILIDGRSVGSLTKDPLLIDPGKHVIEARGDAGATAKQTVEMSAGASASVALTLITLAEQEAAKKRALGEGSPSLWMILGYTGIAVGGTSLLVALGTGIPAITMKSDLDARCPDGRCNEAAWADVDTYDALRWTAGVTLVAGALIAGGGLAALFLDPERESAKATLEPVIAPSFAGLRGTFQ